MNRFRLHQSTSATVVAMMTVAQVLIVLLTACGGGGSSSQTSTPTPTPTPPSSTPVQVSIGDSPADWIMALGMNVNSITLTNSNGGTVNLISSSTPIEMMQLMGTMRPLAITNVPRGSYTQAMVAISSVSMSYMNPVSRQYVQKAVAGTASGTVIFSPSLTVGSTASVLSFDMDMGKSVAIDSSGNVSFTPTFAASMSPASASGQSPWQGWMQHMVGSISSVSSSQFTMDMLMGMRSLTFATNSRTQFVGMSGMGMMGNGMIVSVDSVTQSDGSLLAQRVESMESDSNGMMADGIVTTMAGNPPIQLTMVTNDGIGGGMMMSAIGKTFTVNVSSSTPYNIDSDGVDMSNLPFNPTFDDSSIALGQRIETGSTGGMTDSGMMGGDSINADEITLEQQGFRGTVSNYSASGSEASFTLTLAPESAFSTITGTATIRVYQQNGTHLHDTSSIGNGNQVGVRGLLFNDGGAYKMVATWIMP